MNNDTVGTGHEAHNEATSEAARSSLNAMWVGLTPAPKNAATDIVEPLADDADDLSDDSHGDCIDDAGPLAERGRSNALLKRLLAKRLAACRELNGWGQTQAALLLGYKNATQLSLLEQGKRMPPPVLLIQMARVYGVSSDYLLGLSDEPERDPSTAAVKASINQVRVMLDRNATAVCEALHQSHRFDTSQAFRETGVVSRVKYLLDSVTRFREISPISFDDTRGSAKLLYAAREADEAITEVGNLLDQAHRRAEFALRHGRAAMASDGGAK